MITTANGDLFNVNNDLCREIIETGGPLGHNEDKANDNLGFGFVYYGLVRALRPKHTLVIGSGFGFSVACFAHGVKDNDEGMLNFVDPSYSLFKDGPTKTMGGRDTWATPEAVSERFERMGVGETVRHYKMTSEQFFSEFEANELPPLDLAFIDGNHAYKHVAHDFRETLKRSHKNTYIFLHDTNIYIREFLRHAGVKRFLKKKISQHRKAFEFIDFPFASGVALIRVVDPKAWQQLSIPS